MTVDAVPFPFSSRNARYVESKKRLGCLLRIFLQSTTGFCTLLIRENASRPCFPFSRIAQDWYSLLPITRMFKLVRISNFSNLVFKLEHKKNFRLNRWIDVEHHRRLLHRILKFAKRRCVAISRGNLTTLLDTFLLAAMQNYELSTSKR